MPDRRRRSRSDPYTDALRTLAETDPAGEQARVTELLAIFGSALEVDSVQWQPLDPDWPVFAEWLSPDASADGPAEAIPLRYGDQERGQLVVRHSGPLDRDLMNALITSIRLLVCERLLRNELTPLRAVEVRARLDLRGTRHQLVVTRDQERQRLVSSLLRFAGTPLQDVRESVDYFGRSPGVAELEAVRGALDLATERFRTVARGIYPVMLRERGPADTLVQLAATVPAAVSFAGSLGERADWETESGLYHAAAGSIVCLSATGQTVSVALARAGDRLAVTLSGPGIVEAVSAALAAEAGRITALGGGLTVRASDDGVTVEVWLFDGLGYRG